MAVSPRVQSLSSGADMVSILTEYISNPELIKNLQDEVVKLNALTNDEEKALMEAHQLIQQRAALFNEIEQTRKVFEQEVEDHNKNMAEEKDILEKHQADVLAILSDKNKMLDERQAQLDEKEDGLKKWDAKLKETAEKMKGLVQ